MEIKLGSTQFHDLNAALIYIYTQTKSSAWSLLKARIPRMGKTCPQPYLSVEELLQDLIDRYDDVNSTGTAFNALASLKQGQQEKFSDFFVKFQSYANEIQMPEDMQLLQLNTKLNKRYAYALVGNHFHRIRDAAEYLRRCEQQYDAIDKTHNAPNNKDNTQSNKGKSKDQGNKGGESTKKSTYNNETID